MRSQKFSDSNYDKKINQKLQSQVILSVNFTKHVDREYHQLDRNPIEQEVTFLNAHHHNKNTQHQNPMKILKDNYRPMSIMSTNLKILKLLASKIWQYITNIIYQVLIVCIRGTQGCFNIKNQYNSLYTQTKEFKVYRYLNKYKSV